MAGTTGAELPASAANSGRRPIAANVVSWVASKLIRRSTRAVAGLDIDVGARSNADVIMGNFPKVKVSPPCRVFIMHSQACFPSQKAAQIRLVLYCAAVLGCL
jgi:hypothetical protein